MVIADAGSIGHNSCLVGCIGWKARRLFLTRLQLYSVVRWTKCSCHDRLKSKWIGHCLLPCENDRTFVRQLRNLSDISAKQCVNDRWPTPNDIPDVFLFQLVCVCVTCLWVCLHAKVWACMCVFACDCVVMIKMSPLIFVFFLSICIID